MANLMEIIFVTNYLKIITTKIQKLINKADKLIYNINEKTISLNSCFLNIFSEQSKKLTTTKLNLLRSDVIIINQRTLHRNNK